MDDLQLIQQILAGERALYKELVLRHQKSVFKYLSAFNVRAEVIEEIAQDVFTQGFLKLTTYDPEKAQFLTWILTIAKNRTLTYLKTQARQKEDSIEDGEDFSDPRNALDMLEVQQTEERVFKALYQLPTDFKNALILFFINDRSLQEISVIEKCSLGTVKSRLFRGKEMIKRNLEKDLIYEKSI